MENLGTTMAKEPSEFAQLNSFLREQVENTNKNASVLYDLVNQIKIFPNPSGTGTPTCEDKPQPVGIIQYLREPLYDLRHTNGILENIIIHLKTLVG